MTNGTIEFGPAFQIYPEFPNYYWKLTQKFYAGDTYIGKYTMSLSIFGYRKRKNNS